MRVQTRFALMVGVLIAVALAMMLVFNRDNLPDSADTAAEKRALVRPDSHILGEPGTSGVTVVEFLDFECPGCRAVYSTVEDLREKYAGEVTFVLRYFPLEMHHNGERSARAAEAAARQGQLEAMYRKLYDTQESWGGSDEAKDAVFRDFAEELGLDLAQYDADYASDDVAERVQRDVEDGETLGVRATPTIFVDGEPIAFRSEEDLRDAVEDAVADAEKD